MALKVDLEAEAARRVQEHNLEQYINHVPGLLAKADNDEQAKMKVLEKLGVGVYMYPGDEHKKVNWTLFGKNLRLERMSSEPYANYDILTAWLIYRNSNMIYVL